MKNTNWRTLLGVLWIQAVTASNFRNTLLPNMQRLKHLEEELRVNNAISDEILA
jgi:hypothetical protein